MMEKREKRPKRTGAVLGPIAALVLGLWLAGMGTVTWLEACAAREQFHVHFEDATQGFPGHTVESLDDLMYDFMHYYKYVDFRYAPLIDDGTYWSDSDSFGVSMLLWARSEEPGQPDRLLMDDRNCLYLYDWDDEEDTGCYVYIDLDETDFGRELAAELAGEYWISGTYWGGMNGWRGYYEGERFHLVEVAGDYGKTETVGTAEPGQELVKLEAWEAEFHLADRAPVTMEGVTYGSPGDMLLEAPRIVPRDSPWEIVSYARVDLGQRETGEDCYAELTMRYSPLLEAVEHLRLLYLWTLLGLFAVIGLFWWKLRRQLEAPVDEMVRRGEKDLLYVTRMAQSRWQEVCELREVFDRLRDQIREKQTEKEQLTAALEHARATELRRRKMVAQISRELKTPLAVIGSYADGLDGEKDPEEQSRYLGQILEQTEEMDALVLEMLDHSRLEAGRVKLQADRFSLGQLVRQTMERLEPMAVEHGVTLVAQTLEELQIVADEARMGQAVRNLIRNAIRHARPEGKIFIYVYHFEDKTHFTVECQCNPWSQEDLEMIWDSYGPAETAQGYGGLEMPIARAIIGLHGGTCRAEAVYEGVKFHVTLG